MTTKKNDDDDDDDVYPVNRDPSCVEKGGVTL